MRAVYGAPPPFDPPSPPEPPNPNKRYLGDGVYAEYDGYYLWLTTSNGIYDTNKIALDNDVLHAFLKYIDSLRAK